MNELDQIEIPYERQRPSRTSRMCGAAALVMAVRSLGLDCRQEDVWEPIARRDRNGTRAARTHLLAAGALRYGLTSVCLEASRPWPALQRCMAGGVRVILNHRLRHDSPLGHYTVLTAIDADAASLHDPHRGPGQRLTREQLLSLWGPAAGDSEIAGHVLVAIGPRQAEAASCTSCGDTLAAAVPCPRCQSEIPLRPAAPLGCARADCPARLWKRLFCPWCDASIAGL